MKKKLVVYANCQADGIAHFLGKTALAEEYQISVWHNWQVLMKEQSLAGLEWDLAQAEIVVYQPCTGYKCTDGVSVPGSAQLLDHYCKEKLQISFSYIFNHGFFPILKVAPGRDGWITSESVKARAWAPSSTFAIDGDIFRSYNAGGLRYDCARRFLECLAEQNSREQKCDIRMTDFILANYRTQRLFLTQNHLTSAMFVEIARQVIAKMIEPLDLWELVEPRNPPEKESSIESRIKPIPWTDENEVNQNGTLPIHPAVVAELGLQYPPSENWDWYRSQLELMVKEPA